MSDLSCQPLSVNDALRIDGVRGNLREAVSRLSRGDVFGAYDLAGDVACVCESILQGHLYDAFLRGTDSETAHYA